MLIYSLGGEGDAICKLPVVDLKKKKKNPTNNQGRAELFIYLFVYLKKLMDWNLKCASS